MFLVLHTDTLVIDPFTDMVEAMEFVDYLESTGVCVKLFRIEGETAHELNIVAVRHNMGRKAA